MAVLLGGLLVMMPLMTNSRTVVQLMNECGSVPAPLAEEEEVKHACAIGWHTALHTSADHALQALSGLALEDPYNEVDHGEVAVPPPKC